MERLAQRRVDVNRAGDVFQHRAHLQRQRELVRQLADMRAHRLDAEHAVIRLARQDAHEAASVAGVHRQGAAVRHEREHRGDDVLALRLVRPKAGADDLRLREAHRRYHHGIEAALMTRDDLGHHLALLGGLVLQHRLADEIADCPDILHRGAALIVDLHEAAVPVDRHVLQPPAFGRRLAPDRHQDVVRRDVGRRAVLQLGREALLAEPLRLGAQMYRNAVLLQPLRHGLHQRRIVERQDAVQRLDHRDLAAQLAERDAELQPDIAGADHGQPLRQHGQRQRAGGRDHLAAEFQERQLHRQRAVGQDDVLGGHRDLAVRRLHRAGLGIGELRPALDRTHLGALEQGGDAGVQPLHHAVLPFHRLGEVDLRRGCQ